MDALDAQVDMLLAQESKLQFSSFSFEDGVSVGLDLLDRARLDKLPVVVDVFAYGQQLFHAALPRSQADNGEWVARKRRTVLRFSHSSLYMGTYCKSIGMELDQKYYLPPCTYASQGGGFPILLRDGGVIGVVTVSGLAEEDDHALVVAALEAHLTKQQ
ncbi:heme-degrading domain-containing protein [Cohaesibacter celericrescens]|uniref:heme-degrading domain-containing protein n=1 Tax=Cohaesibacter celericrescens TaxID=2067669 RepID=UPI001AECCB2A|nr:heme-degrading domain-containing protein [Cohaesibacter celericrescens]